MFRDVKRLLLYKYNSANTFTFVFHSKCEKILQASSTRLILLSSPSLSPTVAAKSSYALRGVKTVVTWMLKPCNHTADLKNASSSPGASTLTTGKDKRIIRKINQHVEA